MERLKLNQKIEKFILLFSLTILCFAFFSLFSFTVVMKSSGNITGASVMMVILNICSILAYITAYVTGFGLKNKPVMNFMIIAVFFVYMSIMLLLTSFYYSVAIIGVVLSISLFQLVNISPKLKKIILIITFSIFLLIFLVQILNNIYNFWQLREYAFNVRNDDVPGGILTLLLLGMLFFSFHLHVLKAQIKAESDFEKGNLTFRRTP